MDVTVIGCGYVGLVTGTCLASIGHTVRGVEKDTKKLSTAEAFKRATSETAEARGREMPLKVFADQRRSYLIEATTKK